MVWIRPEAQHSEADETSRERVLRLIIFTQPATDTGLLAYVHLHFSDKLIFLPEQGLYFWDIVFASKNAYYKKSWGKERKKNPHNTFHMEKVMEGNNTKKKIIDNSLEGDTSPFCDEWTFRTWNRKKSPAKFQEVEDKSLRIGEELLRQTKNFLFFRDTVCISELM